MSSHLDYLDFDLLFQKRVGTRYPTRVLRAPGGEAQGSFEIPFGDLELENFLLKIGQPRRGVRRVDTLQTQLTRQFGNQLFQAIFGGDLLVSFHSSLEEAERQHRGLRLRLRMNETPELAKLPWEFLHNPSRNQFLTLGRETPVVRYLELQRLIPSLLVKPPLRILVIVSNPRGVPNLNSSDESDRLHEALAPLRESGTVVLEPLKIATLEALQRRLQGPDIHVLHFIGHGGFDAASQDGLLLFEDEHGNQRPVTGGDLGVLLRNHPSLRLGVVNACDGARSSHDDPFAGVAQSLVQQGLPAVIAMQFEISDDAARVFASGFYTALAKGYPVDTALVEARTAIYFQRFGAEWGTPVLFMRAPDGRLFDIQHQESTEENTQRQDTSREAPEIEDKSYDPRKLHSADLVIFVISGGSVLAALLFVAYENQWNVALTLTTLRRASSSYLGSFSISLCAVGIAAYVLLRKELWGKKWLLNKVARTCFLLTVAAGCLGYSFAQEIQTSEDAFEVLVRTQDENSGEPVASIVTVFADRKSVASGLSNPDGWFRMVLPPGLFSSRLTANVGHPGYLTVEQNVLVSGRPLLVSLKPQSVSPLPSVPFKSKFTFGRLPTNLSVSTAFNYGFSSLELDRNVKGNGVQIKWVRVDVNVRTHLERATCDVWVLLGPAPFDLKAYGPDENPFLIEARHAVAPAQVRFVIGSAEKSFTKEGRISFYGAYDFQSQQWSGNIYSHKDSFTDRLDLPNGLYAQIFLWNGSPDVNLDVETLSLAVEGTKPNEQ